MKKDRSAFSELDHVGVIVKDIDKTIEILAALGIGPFEPFYRVPITERTFRGKPTNVKNEIRYAKLGQVEMELVQPLEGESIASESLESRGEGLFHLGFVVDDVWAEADKLTRQGINIIQASRRPTGGGAVFFGSDRSGGIIFELLQSE